MPKRYIKNNNLSDDSVYENLTPLANHSPNIRTLTTEYDNDVISVGDFYENSTNDLQNVIDYNHQLGDCKESSTDSSFISTEEQLRVQEAKDSEDEKKKQNNIYLKYEKEATKPDLCDFCHEKKYFYDLFFLRTFPSEKTDTKICLDCGIDRHVAKRKLVDVEYKEDRLKMFEPQQCYKCKAYRSIFRLRPKKNKKDESSIYMYCDYCAKKRFYDNHRYNHDRINKPYVSRLKEVYADLNKHN